MRKMLIRPPLSAEASRGACPRFRGVTDNGVALIEACCTRNVLLANLPKAGQEPQRDHVIRWLAE
jgi:hypothetical protein